MAEGRPECSGQRSKNSPRGFFFPPQKLGWERKEKEGEWSLRSQEKAFVKWS